MTYNNITTIQFKFLEGAQLLLALKIPNSLRGAHDSSVQRAPSPLKNKRQSTRYLILRATLGVTTAAKCDRARACLLISTSLFRAICGEYRNSSSSDYVSHVRSFAFCLEITIDEERRMTFNIIKWIFFIFCLNISLSGGAILESQSQDL